MSYEVSRISEAAGATIRYIVWDVDILETYPTDFDDQYRLIKFLSIRTTKSSVIALSNTNIRMVREGFGPSVRLYSRFYDTAEVTGDPANLQGGELVSFTTTTFTPSETVVGSGVLMPQRSQIEASLNSQLLFDVLLEMVVVEARSPEALAVYV